MKPILPILSCLPLLLLDACGAAPPAAETVTHEVSLKEQPQSAFVALVRALEVLDAVRDPEARVRLRAVECDSLVDHRQGGEFVRIILDLTVLAPDFDRAYALFEDLQHALDAEASAGARVDRVAEHRLRRVFDDMDWSAHDVGDEETFRSLVSISSSIRLEVRHEGAVGPSPWTTGVDHAHGTPATQDAGEYIRAAAVADENPLGPVDIDVRVVQPRRGISDLRYRIRPASDEIALGRDRIGRFLFELEAGSPGVRITRLAIVPFAPGSDVGQDTWTFEADMCVRLVDSSAG